jgi:tetratricopeptide (TPR) repeat protein
MHTSRVSSVLVILAALSTSAWADRTHEAKKHFEEGQKHFAFGEFDQAADEYELAYKAKPDPALLYDAAQSFRLANRPERALMLYRSYVQLYPGAQNLAEVKAQILKLKEAIAAADKAKNAPPPSTAAPQSFESSTVAVTRSAHDSPATRPVLAQTGLEPAGPVGPPAAPRDVGNARDPGRAMKIGGLITVSVGVVSLALGGVFTGLAKQTSDEITNAPSFSPASEDQLHRDQALEAAFYAIGGAAVVAGVTTYLIGRRESQRAWTVGVAPSRSSASLDLSWKF